MRRKGLATLLALTLLVPLVAGFLALASTSMAASTKAQLLEQKAVELENARRLEALEASTSPSGIIVENKGPLKARIVGVHMVSSSGQRIDKETSYVVHPGSKATIPISVPNGYTAYLVTSRGNIVPVKGGEPGQNNLFLDEYPLESLPGLTLSYTGFGGCYYALISGEVLEELCGEPVWWAKITGYEAYAAVTNETWLLAENGYLYFYRMGFREPRAVEKHTVYYGDWYPPTNSLYYAAWSGPWLLNDGYNKTVHFWEERSGNLWVLYKWWGGTLEVHDYYVWAETITDKGPLPAERLGAMSAIGYATQNAWSRVATAYSRGVFAALPVLSKPSDSTFRVSLLYARIGGEKKNITLGEHPTSTADGGLCYVRSFRLILNPPYAIAGYELGYCAGADTTSYSYRYLVDLESGAATPIPADTPWGSGDVVFLNPDSTVTAARIVVSSSGAWLTLENYSASSSGYALLSNKTYQLPYLPIGGRNWDYVSGSDSSVSGPQKGIVRLPDGSIAVLTSAGYYIPREDKLLKAAAEPEDPESHALLLPDRTAVYLVPTNKPGVYGLQEAGP